ncbi:uncharacterized protein LOC119865678 isoform X4 [Canis lupus familiaris]|uniref:uncharacterized protein LOC119865678 isoform X4 n=1 Tax=Canis lupus familiaris TaxID=9615 RepID=UPI0018F75394|nr:uncharacterized protein LOC119865678 isoform X4 [Canis lupus familiaris]
MSPWGLHPPSWFPFILSLLVLGRRAFHRGKDHLSCSSAPQPLGWPPPVGSQKQTRTGKGKKKRASSGLCSLRKVPSCRFRSGRLGKVKRERGQLQGGTSREVKKGLLRTLLWCVIHAPYADLRTNLCRTETSSTASSLQHPAPVYLHLHLQTLRTCFSPSHFLALC